ncbi:MAG TPA: hypothetical protein VK009_09560 [Chloroflexota bacterium]|nr:hypothetical protein [Chloroflexota bacterium]
MANRRENDNQHAVHEFLKEHYRTQDSFTKAELRAITKWPKEDTFRTYWAKQYAPLLVRTGANRFRVGEAFRPFVSWQSFQRHVSQVRRVSSDYTFLTYSKLLIFEFFMPLRNETILKSSLDTVFYKDRISARLKAVSSELHMRFPKRQGETDDQYMAFIQIWLADRFSGYSIHHVAGRFKGDATLSFKEVAKLQGEGGQYLFDETTAVVRFIFRVGIPSIRKPPLQPGQYEVQLALEDNEANTEIEEIRWFFWVLFVETILQVVNGEDEVWMLETGVRQRLYVWKLDPPQATDPDRFVSLATARSRLSTQQSR